MRKRLKKLIFSYLPTLARTEILIRLPSLYRLFEISPSSCTILITNRCNLKCVMCKQWKEIPKIELSLEDWKKIIDDLKKNGIKNIHFSGGEPLLRKDILKDLVSYSTKNGFVTGLTTNGTLLQKEDLNDLITGGLRSIAVSIDALDRKYDRIRGTHDMFEKVKDTVQLVAGAYKTKKIDAYINFTLMKDNLGDLKEVKGFSDEIGLSLAICLLDKTTSIFNIERNKSQHWITEEDDFKNLNDILHFIKEEKKKSPRSLIVNYPVIEYIRNYYKDPIQRDIPCVSSQDRIIIDPYGEFSGGCMAMGSFGNIKQETLSKLRNNKQYKERKKRMFYKICPGCSCGYLFNIKCTSRLVLKDLKMRIKYAFLRGKG